MTQYRIAEIKDINRIMKLEVECMTELHNKIGGEFPVFDERHNNEANLISIIEGGCGCAFLAEEYDNYGKGDLIGAVIAIDEEMKTAEEEEHNKLVIDNIFVEQSYRKQGIAHKLLEMINEWARAHNYKGIKIMIYTPNEEARQIFIDDSYVLTSEIREKML